MMGSRVHAGSMTLETALAVADDRGITVGQALRSSGQAGPLTPSPRGWSCWLEAHVEQGPVLEAEAADIGIVTGTMHARYLQLTITGEPSHVGPTTMDRRHDSLAAAPRSSWRSNGLPMLRSRTAVPRRAGSRTAPNARGAVSAMTRLHCDARHEAADRAVAMERELRASIAAIAARRRVNVDIDPYTTFGPVAFDTRLSALFADAAAVRQLATRDIIAAAGHDSVLIAPLCPSAMLFVPSQDGITHNPREYTAPAQLARGAELLLDVILELAG